MAKDESNIISLIDDNGNEVPFELMDIIEYEGDKFVILLPVEDAEEGVVILKAEEEEDGTEGYVSIDDDETLDTVFDMFKARFSDTFTFGD